MQNYYKLLLQKLPIFLFFMQMTVIAQCSDLQRWHPTFGVQSGIAALGKAGVDQDFPIDATSDQFYIYNYDGTTKIPFLYGGFVGIEWRGDTDWRFQLQIDYNQSSDFATGGALTQGIDAASQETYAFDYTMQFRQLLGLVKVEYARWNIVSPYFMFGLGSSFNSARDFATTVPVTLATTRIYENQVSKSVSFALGAGFNIHVIDQVCFSFGYRFANVGTIGLGDSTVNGIAVTGTLSQKSLYANEFVVQLSALF